MSDQAPGTATGTTAPVLATLDLEVEGMTCASCVALVERRLTKIPGVTATVNLPLATAHAAPTCSAKYVPPRRNTRAISPHHTDAGCRLETKSNAPSANGRGGSTGCSTTTTPRAPNSRVALTRFGGHDSVATAVGGNTPASASTSPPPV